MKIDGNTRMAAVVAHPIRHSLSPLIHNLAFDLMDENAVYLAWDVKEKEFSSVIKNIQFLDMYGVNLSMPYKSLLLNKWDKLSDRVQLIGAANTIVRKNGQLIAHNTDGYGFFKSLLEEQNFNPKDKNITILGAGAAAKAIIIEALFKEVKEISIFIRKSSSYSLVEAWLKNLVEKRETQVFLYDLDDYKNLQEKIYQSDLLIQATSVGMDGKSLVFPKNISGHSHLLCVDLIYRWIESPFLLWARRQNLRAVNGLDMLIYQAAESFRLWTDKEMPLERIKREVEKEVYVKK
ncbi:MAG: shikimate dehydrogenase [Lactovum sp.]